MRRSSLPYALAFGVLILLKLIFSYFSYRRSVKKYRRIFRRTLIREGVPRKMANELSESIKTIRLRDMAGTVKFSRFM